MFDAAADGMKMSMSKSQVVAVWSHTLSGMAFDDTRFLLKFSTVAAGAVWVGSNGAAFNAPVPVALTEMTLAITALTDPSSGRPQSPVSLMKNPSPNPNGPPAWRESKVRHASTVE